MPFHRATAHLKRLGCQGALAAALVAVLAGCEGSSAIPVGPFAAEKGLGIGEVSPNDLPDDAGFLGVVEKDLPICEAFTRAVIEEEVKEQIAEENREFFHVTEVLLNELVISSRGGNFRRIGRVDVYYVPPPFGDLPRIPQFLGRAQSLLGFGDEINIELSDPFNVLDAALLAEQREDEAQCPALRFRVIGRPPDEIISFDITANADVFGELRF